MAATIFSQSSQSPLTIDHAPTAPDTQIHYGAGLPLNKFATQCNFTGTAKAFIEAFPLFGVAFVPTLLRPVSRGVVELASSVSSAVSTSMSMSMSICEREWKIQNWLSYLDWHVLLSNLWFCRGRTRSPSPSSITAT